MEVDHVLTVGDALRVTIYSLLVFGAVTLCIIVYQALFALPETAAAKNSRDDDQGRRHTDIAAGRESSVLE